MKLILHVRYLKCHNVHQPQNMSLRLSQRWYVPHWAIICSWETKIFSNWSVYWSLILFPPNNKNVLRWVTECSSRHRGGGGAERGRLRRNGSWSEEGAQGMTIRFDLSIRKYSSWTSLRNHERFKSYVKRIQEHKNQLTSDWRAIDERKIIGWYAVCLRNPRPLYIRGYLTVDRRHIVSVKPLLEHVLQPKRKYIENKALIHRSTAMSKERS